MNRTQRRDWLEVGLTLLRDEGEQALTIEKVCAALKLTKGAFYHHFQNAEDFRAALLGLWQERHTALPIAQAQQVEGGQQRLGKLAALIRPLDHRLDLAVRAWSLRSAEARAAFDEVDRLRVAFLAELHRQSGHGQPQQLAQQEYAEFVGRQCLGWLEGWPTRLGVDVQTASE